LGYEFQAAAALGASDEAFIANHAGNGKMSSVQQYKDLEEQRLEPLKMLYEQLRKSQYYTG
jgi:hypothetical protein